MAYTVSFPDPASHAYQVQLNTSGWNVDFVDFKMPQWMPGYYQIMNYSKDVALLVALDDRGKKLPVEQINDHTWRISNIKNKTFHLTYTIRTSKQFVANSYVDISHAYLIPENSFLYVDGYLSLPVIVKMDTHPGWSQVATGLEPIVGKRNEFSAPDFNVLYDCPILAGTLEELPSFKVNGIEHRFLGYQIGSFDKVHFMQDMEKIVRASIDIFGDIPYARYSFIAMGPGRGGIEHLNNTTFGFDGNSLDQPSAYLKMMNFLAHEYFHHYNVKRIRPFELGPFDYEKGSRTNQLWVSEGISVYYEYLLVRRAGIINGETLLSLFEANISHHENNPGRMYQSLAQASYSTWKDGPFGSQGEDPKKSISYYEKGPIVGLFLDLAIRNATHNDKSLDDVMKLLYKRYYKLEGRGFTDAEFQQTCEEVSNISMTGFFEYIYTTRELDYSTYLGYAGLKFEIETTDQVRKISIHKMASPGTLQSTILHSWLGE